MASTYSDLKFELIGTGEQSGTWGVTTNTNLGTAIEEAITGSADVTFASGTVTLTLTDTNASQTARNLRLNLTGTSGGAQDLIVPNIEKFYLVNNGCADAITVKNSTGTGVAVPAGKAMLVFNNATNVVDAVNHFNTASVGTLTLTNALAVAQGGTGATTADNALTNLGATTTGKAVFTAANAAAVRTAAGAGAIGGNVFTAATAAAAQQAMDTEVGVDVQAYDADLTAIGALAKTDGNFIVGDGSTWVAESGATARTSIGLGSANDVQFDSFGVGTAASGTTGEIRATNNVTAYYSSDIKFKENVNDIENALDKVKIIGGKTFDWTDEYIKSKGGEDGYFIQKKDIGVIAQDVQAVLPQAVRERDDGSLAVDYPKLVALAFAAINELKEEINKLKG